MAEEKEIRCNVKIGELRDPLLYEALSLQTGKNAVRRLLTLATAGLALEMSARNNGYAPAPALSFPANAATADHPPQQKVSEKMTAPAELPVVSQAEQDDLDDMFSGGVKL